MKAIVAVALVGLCILAIATAIAMSTRAAPAVMSARDLPAAQQEESFRHTENSIARTQNAIGRIEKKVDVLQRERAISP